MAGEAAAKPLPTLDRTQPVVCYEDSDGNRWRLQCDDEKKKCLYAPDAIVDGEGKQVRELERAGFCRQATEDFDVPGLQAQGYELIPARAEAPYGWTRDERGRVFQTNFDLKRRLYVGGGYAPGNGELAGEERFNIEFGVLVLETGTKRTRHRLRLVEGEVTMAPFSADLTLLHYDLSHRFENPLLRITTFFGAPRRHDFGLDIGFWFEGGGLEVYDTTLGDQQLWKLATAHATVDLWRSPDLYSFVRFRGGVGVEHGLLEGEGDRTAITPAVALEGDITLDQRGFYNVGAMLSYERPFYTETHPMLGERARRITAEVSYEMIVLAINDQPLSLRLAGGAERRDDIPGVAEEWALQGNASLRFSLWAPPRQLITR